LLRFLTVTPQMRNVMAQTRKEKAAYQRAYRQTAAGKATHNVGQARYQQTSKGRATHAKADARYHRLHPNRRVARTAVDTAIAAGKLTRLPCMVCGNPKSEAHHDDYAKPLDVQWLCTKHHKDFHRSQT
jgi:hypothetical protein